MDARVRTGCECGYGHSVTSAHVDLAIDANATWQDAFQFGTPGDTTWTLTGQTFKMNVQLTYFDATPLLQLSSSAGTIITDDPIQRVIHFNVPMSSIEPVLNPGAYVYDLIMTDSSTPGIRTALMHGTICVSAGVTT